MSSGTRLRSAGSRANAAPKDQHTPDLAVEIDLRRGGFTAVASVDEVGRGAVAGPVSVGAVLVGADLGTPPPAGLRDSKLLTPAARTALVPALRAWVAGAAVGHAGATEIDAIGIIAALRLATHRALAALPERPDCVLLDGTHDYVTPPTGVLTEALTLERGDRRQNTAAPCPPVHTLVRADLRCASVAAASVIAKTTRDALMDDLARLHAGYGWETNRGYGTRAHLAAIRSLGPTPHHRRSWNLPSQQLLGSRDVV